MNVLGVIPARGGSKGIPNKNLRELAGKPLLAYTRDAAKASGVIDRLVLSTDSKEIAELGKSLGLEVPFMRPAELAADESPMLEVLQHAVSQIESNDWKAEIIVLLQPPSPLRRPEHVRRAVEILKEGGSDSVVSVVEIPHQFAPQKALKLKDGWLKFWSEDGKTLTRRQQIEASYAREGTVYACWRDTLIKQNSLYGARCRPLVLDENESLSLDSMVDWRRAEMMLSGESQRNFG